MSNRNLTHYFSPNVVKPNEKAILVDDVSKDTVAPSVSKRSRSRSVAKEDSIVLDNDDDFENDPILPPRDSQSITKYFSPVDRTAMKRKPKPCVMTVEVQVHGSPKKPTRTVVARKATRKKKKKSGIPSCLADTIELVSSEEMVSSESSSSLEPMEVTLKETPPVEMCKSRWKMKIRLEDSTKASDDDSEENSCQAGPRRSTRMRFKPIAFDEPKEVESKKVPKKRRKKGSVKEPVEEDDGDIEIISEDVAPIFIKKKLEEEQRAVKKAKQEFLFSGVPEVLKQQNAIQVALEQRPVEIFPKISHVTQAGSRPWKLPYPDHLTPLLQKDTPCLKLNYPLAFPTGVNSSQAGRCSSYRSTTLVQASHLEWRYCKDWITRLKEENSLSFPFFRTLRTLLLRSTKNGEEGSLLPWTDAYAPQQSMEILVNNRKPSQRLKEWLNQWKRRAGEEVLSSPKKPSKKMGKRKRISSDGSGMDEPVVNETSNSSWNPDEQLGNCVLLVGPGGCGKTATVYALAEELGYNVLEVNASSKRNGKTVLSHLHEATQSHSLSNSNNTGSVANGMAKLFFGGKGAAKVNRKEQKSSLSLVLFEDVDIVFESEDESFYSALTTLIQTSKRPIVLTLGSTEERTLTLIHDRIKSYFDVFSFVSPDHSTVCGYIWCLCLAEGYPLEWKTLETWVKSRTVMNTDLRSLLLELQFLLQSHPLRLKLNFSQLQLKNVEESPNCERSWNVPNGGSDATQVRLIELPNVKGFHDWSYSSAPKSLRFTYDADHDAIAIVEAKDKKRFSRILSNGSSDKESDTEQQSIPMDEEAAFKNKSRSGELAHLALCLDIRAGKEIFSSCMANERLSWNEASLLQDIEQVMTDGCLKLMEKNSTSEATLGSLESCTAQRRDEQSTRSANHILLQGSVSKSTLLHRGSHSADVLPYLRSLLRLDLERAVGKRRRKNRSRLESPTTRLPSLDLLLPTSSAIQLANNL